MCQFLHSNLKEGLNTQAVSAPGGRCNKTPQISVVYVHFSHLHLCGMCIAVVGVEDSLFMQQFRNSASILGHSDQRGWMEQPLASDYLHLHHPNHSSPETSRKCRKTSVSCLPGPQFPDL